MDLMPTLRRDDDQFIVRSNPGMSASPTSYQMNQKKRTKAPRKSRSKGLRTRTGCITCRNRHKKCNEVLPVCGNCVSGERTCIWPSEVEEAERQLNEDSSIDLTETLRDHNRNNPTATPILPTPFLQRPVASREINQQQNQTTSPFLNHVSPSGTVDSESWTADFASVRWLDLLATDALQANRGFTRPSTPFIEEFVQATVPNAVDAAQIDPQLLESNGTRTSGTETFPWQLDRDIALKNLEVAIFRNFVEHSSLWLDLFDPDNHFSVYTLRLSLRNTGLMNAILALSAQHLSRQDCTKTCDAASDPNLAIQYYYETLHYVQTALQYNSYAYSEELLATALIISTYEMLDESDSGWQRHLKGVFWIQRSQDVNGASGGIRQAVWWAWLRQDVWAAFRERRRCLSFWKSQRDFSDLSQSEMVHMATYLLSQAVNYCADTTALAADPESVSRSIKAADELLSTLDKWRSFLADDFKSLPVKKNGSVFKPLWIHPPSLGVALQTFYFARIIIIMHRPAKAGFNSFLKVQKLLSEAVAMICGIAMELTDEGCQVISAQCLYGAGLCVQDTAQRNEIKSLINACGARTGWPMSSLCEDLRREWNNGDSEALDELN